MATAPAVPAPRSPKIQRFDAPEASSTPSTITTMTITEPRSGMPMTTIIGTAARPRALATVRWSGCGWSPASTRAASSIAMPRMIVILVNSEGWSEKPPGSRIQAWAPLTVAPSGVRTAITRSTDRPYRTGTAPRRVRWPSQIVPTIRAKPMPVLRACRKRKKYGSPWVSESRPLVAE